MKNNSEKKGKHPLWIAILLLIVSLLYLIVTSTVCDALFGEEPFVLTALVVIQYALLLGMIRFISRKLKNRYDFGMHTGGFGIGLVLSLPLLPFVALNVLSLFTEGLAPDLTALSILSSLLNAVTTGIREELLFRAILIGGIMLQFKENKHRIYLALFCPAIAFGLFHFVNLLNPDANFSSTVLQVFYASVSGIVFGVVYLRSRNLWSAVVPHAVFDFLNFISAGEGGEPSAMEIGLIVIVCVVMLSASLWLIRKSKHDDTMKLWCIYDSPAKEDGSI